MGPNASRKACDKSWFVLAAGNELPAGLLECVMIELFEDEPLPQVSTSEPDHARHHRNCYSCS
jgi:hypothetical protein